MFISTTQDLFYLIAGICLVFITGFLVWALFELGRLLKQTNEVVGGTREKIMRFSERLAHLSRYMGIFAEGSRQILSFFQEKKKTKKIKEKISEFGDS